MAKLKQPVQHVGDLNPPKPTVKLREANRCAAYGCPLPGTMSNSTSASAEWWCYVHVWVDPLHTQRATEIINKHGELIAEWRELARKMASRPRYETIDCDKRILAIRQQIADAVSNGLKTVPA